jgi:hypothetical protein
VLPIKGSTGAEDVRIGEIEDRFAIQELLSLYALGVDMNQFERIFDGVSSHDAVLDRGLGEVRGREGLWWVGTRMNSGVVPKGSLVKA